MHIWPIPIVCNNFLCEIPERDPPHMYVHTYLVRIEPHTNALSNKHYISRQACTEIPNIPIKGLKENMTIKTIIVP